MAAVFGKGVPLHNISRHDFVKAIDTLVYEGASSSVLSVTGILVGTVAPVTLIANALVIGVAAWDPYKRLHSRPVNKVITSLALVDLLVGLLTPLVVMWHMNPPGTAELQSVTTFTISNALAVMSGLHILILTLDRSVAITWPLHYRVHVTHKSTSSTVAAIWIYAVAFGVVQFLLHRNFFHIAMFLYVANVNVILFVITVLFVVVICRLKKHDRKLLGTQVANPNDAYALHKRECKITKSMILLQIAFKVCFIPLFVSWTLIWTCWACQPGLHVLAWIFAISMILPFVCSCLNPFLYAFKTPTFRKPIRRLIRKVMCRLKSQDVVETSIHATGRSNGVQDSRF